MESEDKQGKKARTFDFIAMFQEARQTAIERSGDNPVPEAADSTPDEPKKLHKKTKKEEQEKKHRTRESSSDEDSEEDRKKGNESSDDEIGPPLLPAFKPTLEHQKPTGQLGKAEVQNDDDEDDEDIGPPLPPGFTKPSLPLEVDSKTDSPEDSKLKTSNMQIEEKDDEDEDGDTAEEEDNPLNKIPTSHEIVFDHGQKTISALALDPSGARLVTGSIDFDVKFWDFAGMDLSLKSFRPLRPCECHQIKNLEYS
ncbi:WD repeat-containing protein 70 [Elysia marginata]|uniref:WD repeat-containing protein 70 n=1 Tax=Elysia marginata TaxID=1093978 RepID=A0AAV4G4P8_9GAST|nr:WD repeat-containing protein 70 [Elysia marginata]